MENSVRIKITDLRREYKSPGIRKLEHMVNHQFAEYLDKSLGLSLTKAEKMAGTTLRATVRKEGNEYVMNFPFRELEVVPEIAEKINQLKIQEAEEEQYNRLIFDENHTMEGVASGLFADRNVPKLVSTGRIDYQWNHKKVHFDEALRYARAIPPNDHRMTPLNGPTNINVFQLDTGYSNHPAIVNAPSYKKNDPIVRSFIQNEATAEDSLMMYSLGLKNWQKPGHGTATAYTMIGESDGIPEAEWPSAESLERASPGLGIFKKNYGKGLFPYVHFYPIRVAKYVGFSNGFIGELLRNFGIKTNDPYSLVDGLKHAGTNGADVITMSIGGRIKDDTILPVVKENYKKGIIMVCAAGNSKQLDTLEDEISPAHFTETICVAALEPIYNARDQNIHIVPWVGSCDGDLVDISAPGKYIFTALAMDPAKLWDGAPHEDFQNGHVYKWGGATSQATVHVSSAAALWRHTYQKILSTHPAYTQKKSNIVEAFRFALYASRETPLYWKNTVLKEYKGLLNVRGLIDSKHAPDSDRCLHYLKLVNNNRNKRKTRFDLYKELPVIFAGQ